MTATVCAVPRCPRPAAHRGRCAIHAQTTTDRGYGWVHQLERRTALPGARCERCGCTRRLQRDHLVPGTLGGGQERANKRWLCACPEHHCHQTYGLRRDRPQGGAPWPAR